MWPSRPQFAGLAAVAVALLVSPVRPAAADDDTLRDEAKRLFGSIEAASDLSVNAPVAVLGRTLFWDARISGDGKTACATCHLPEDWGADRRRFSPDARGKMTSRNSQTVFNAMPQTSLRWSGDRKSGAHQAEKSLAGSMGLASAEAVAPVLRRFGYEPAFRAAFPGESDPVSAANYGRALEAYQATLATPAAFDRLLAGDNAALSPPQKAGLKVFINSGCADCHHGPLLGGRSIEKFGVVKDYWTATGSEKRDPGRFEATQDEADRYKFRVPMLRNIARTAPYFHDGSVAKLDEAVQIMAEVQLGDRLGEADAAAVVAFLDALTGDVPKHFAPPTVRVVP